MPLYHLPGADVQRIAVDRAYGHRYVMSLLENGLNRQSPRADASLLWAITPQGVFAQTPYPLDSAYESPTPPLPKSGEAVVLTGDITILYSPVVTVPQKLWDQGYRPRRAKKITAPADKRHKILTAQLGRHGLQVTKLSISEPKSITVGRGAGAFVQTYFTVTVFGIVADENSVHKLIHQGIGKAKNYGLGWLRHF